MLLHCRTFIYEKLLRRQTWNSQMPVHWIYFHMYALTHFQQQQKKPITKREYQCPWDLSLTKYWILTVKNHCSLNYSFHARKINFRSKSIICKNSSTCLNTSNILPRMSLIGKNCLSVIRQKGESLNGGSKKTKHSRFSEKRTFLTLWYTHLRVCIRE